jgi:hypothetical protein
MLRRDAINGQFPQRGGVNFQRRAPLRLVLFVAESDGEIGRDLISKGSEGRELALALLAAIGSTPLRINRRACRALSRASARPTSG